MKLLFVHSPPIKPSLQTSPYLLRVSSPQLGLLYLASVLEKAGYKVEYIDAANRGMSPGEVVADISKSDNLWLGFYSNIASKQWVLEAIKNLRAKSFKQPIIVGGPGFIEAKDYFDAGATAVVAGEAENIVVPLSKAIESEGEIEKIEGVYTKTKLSDDIPKPAPPPFNLDELPYPAWHLAPPKNYQDPFAIQAKSPMYYVLASRGCFMNCAFCFQTYKGTKFYRLRSVDSVLDEIKELFVQYKVRHIKFQDDNFGGNTNWLEEFCKKKIERLPTLTWHCSMHIITFRKESEKLVDLLARAGCRSVHFGLQTTLKEQLKEINRFEYEPEILSSALPILKKAGIYTIVDFIFGLPHESRQTIEAHKKYIMSLRAHAIQINPLNLVPYTELWFKYKDKIFRALGQSEIDTELKRVLRQYMLRPSVIWWNLKYVLFQNPRAFLKLIRAIPLLTKLVLGRFRNPWIAVEGSNR